jgi:hypothetical protein
MEEQCRADRQFIDGSDAQGTWLASSTTNPTLQRNPTLTDYKGKTDQHGEFRKVSPRPEFVILDIDGKILPPLRLPFRGHPVGRRRFARRIVHGKLQFLD